MKKYINAALYSVLGIATWVSLASLCLAQSSFEFIHAETGDLLATMEISTLPATFSEVTSFTFSAAGDELFGFGVGLYRGVFDSGNDEMFDIHQPSGELRGLGEDTPILTDTAPPDSRLFDSQSSSFFSVSLTGRLGLKRPKMTYGTAFVSELTAVEGRWVESVPEPSGLVLATSLFVAAFYSRWPRTLK